MDPIETVDRVVETLVAVSDGLGFVGTIFRPLLQSVLRRGGRAALERLFAVEHESNRIEFQDAT